MEKILCIDDIIRVLKFDQKHLSDTFKGVSNFYGLSTPFYFEFAKEKDWGSTVQWTLRNVRSDNLLRKELGFLVQDFLLLIM